jgi:hypothetical protein
VGWRLASAFLIHHREKCLVIELLLFLFLNGGLSLLLSPHLVKCVLLSGHHIPDLVAQTPIVDLLNQFGLIHPENVSWRISLQPQVLLERTLIGLTFNVHYQIKE